MKTTWQIAIMVVLLMVTGISMILYKHFVLGFPLFSSESAVVWKVESRIDFDALGGPVTVRVKTPDAVPGARFLVDSDVAHGFSVETVTRDGQAFQQWHKPDSWAGPHSLYTRTDVFFQQLPVMTQDVAPEPERRELDDLHREVLENASEAIEAAGLSGEPLVREILRELNSPSAEHLGVLLQDLTRRSDKLQIAIDLLALGGLTARLSRGVLLEDRLSNRGFLYMLKVWEDKQWKLYDPREIAPVAWDRFIEFQEGRGAIYEVEGGENSNLELSIVRENRSASATAVQNARTQHSAFVDFSIFSLPVAQQSTFKLLLLMPLGALVVVILRNLVGLRTSGTFMPILISLAFLQTGLLVGVVLFLMVVGTGLVVRSYLTRLNLLLVPRIAAVLVFVIIIYGAIGITGHKLGWEWGLSVTLFPLIILSWTIERMSILWDEEGAREVFIQGGGSLLTASLAYLLMSHQGISDAIFLYPEALLILLAVIIAIGSYSGYRLSDLRRFEPMERY